LKHLIKDIATTQTGLFARPSEIGEAVYLQSKYFDDNGILKYELIPDLPLNQISDKHILRDGDVLFSAKGTKNFATVYECKYNVAVASTSFFVLRTIGSNILPEYLSWFLNNPQTQRLIKDKARGTDIPSIRKTDIEDLEIPLPSIEKQRLIAELSNLAKKETELRVQLTDLKKKIVEQKILFNLKTII